MHKLRTLIVPTAQEVFFYLFLGLGTLLVVNAGVLWNNLLRTAGTDDGTALLFSQSYKELIARHTTLSDPQLINAVEHVAPQTVPVRRWFVGFMLA